MPRAMRSRFQRSAVSGLAWNERPRLQEGYRCREETRCVVGVPVWSGEGIFSRICQRSALQPSPGTALWRRTASCSRGAVQGVRQGCGLCLSTGCTNRWLVAQHQRETLTRLLNSRPRLYVEPMSRKLDYASAADDALVKAAQKAEMQAFEELVARHRDKIYARAVSMMRNEEEAADLSQEAWVKAWQRLKQFQGEASFVTWMTRIIINLCLDQLRKQQRLRAESSEQMDEESGGGESQMPTATANPTDRLDRGGIGRTSRWEREWSSVGAA